MLRITVEPFEHEDRLKLEGDLTGTWVRDLEESWRTAREGGRGVGLDLTGVTKVAAAGRYRLALSHDCGAPIVSSGFAMKELLESIARDWPGRPAGGPSPLRS